MKRGLALTVALVLLVLCAGGAARAQSVEDRLAEIVARALEQEELPYDYDGENQWFELEFDLGGALDAVEVTLFLYDDMVSVLAFCPIWVGEECFEQAAIFTTLANNELYDAQFQVDRDYEMITCRSCNVIERVLPSEDEILTLLYAPLFAMMDYGNGLAAVCMPDADPYEAFEACRAALDAE